MKELLTLLERDATLSTEQLAAMLKLTPGEIKNKIKELEDQKIILKRQTVINWDKAGSDTVTAIIEVKITPQREFGFDAIAERIYRFPEVNTLYLMSGSFDLLAIITEKTLQEVAQFVATRLATIEGVVGTKTHFLLKKYKDAGTIMDDKEEDRRLVVSP